MKIYFLIFVYALLSCSGNQDELKREYSLGKDEFMKGNLEGSKKHFKQVLKFESSYEDVSLYIAKIEYYQGHFALASKAFELLLDDKSYGFQAQILKLKSDYANQKDRAILLSEIGNAIKKDSSNLDLLILSAKLHEELGQISQSIFYYQRVLNESEKIILAHKALREIYQKVGLNERANYHLKKIELWKNE